LDCITFSLLEYLVAELQCINNVKDFFSGDAIGTFIFGFLIIPMVSIGKFIELINTKPLWQSKDKKMKKVLYEDECNS
jgi:hypothetical protein